MAMQSKLLLWMALVAGLAAAMSVQLVTWALTPGRPLEIISSEALTPQVSRGGDLIIKFHVKRSRACPALINGFLLDESGAAVWRYEQALAGYSMVGESSVVVKRPIGVAVPLGRTCYRHVRIDACEERTFVTPQRDVCFEVVP